MPSDDPPAFREKVSEPQEFTIHVTPIKGQPGLDPLNDLNLSMDAPEQVISLKGISAGRQTPTPSFVVKCQDCNS